MEARAEIKHAEITAVAGLRRETPDADGIVPDRATRRAHALSHDRVFDFNGVELMDRP